MRYSNLKLILSSLLIACTVQASTYYYIRMPDSTYTAQLRGVTGTTSAGQTLTGTWVTGKKAHRFTVTKTGPYKLYADPAGGSSYVLDSAWSGTNGKAVAGDDLATWMLKLNSSYQVKSNGIGDTSIATAKIKNQNVTADKILDSTITLAKLNSTVRDSIIANITAGNVTEIQFNDGGSLGTDSQFTYDKNNNIMTVKKAMTDTTAVVDKLMVGSAADIEFGSSGGGVITLLAPSDAESDFTLRIPDPATDATLVVTEGAQTVNGVKTFGSFPVTPSSAPTTDYQAANKKYVDDAAAPAGSDTEIQYNKAGGKGADAAFTYNESTNTMTVKKAMTDTTGVVDKLMIGSAADIEFGSSGGGVITLLAPSDAESDFDLRIPDPATDATLVVTEGAQTVNGVKTFGSFPVTPSSAPTTDYQAANKKYVDDKVIADSAHIANNAVTSETIVDLQVKTADLAANAVDSSKIAPSAVRSTDIGDQQVKTADIDSTGRYPRHLEGFIGPNNAIKYDRKGNANIMVWIPRFNWDEDGGFNSATVHPAFIVNGVTKSGIWVSKYENVVLDSSTAAIYSAGTLNTDTHTYIASSQPGKSARHSISFDAARKACTNMNNGTTITGWHLMTNAEWAAVALWCKDNATMPLGNNNYGRDVESKHVTGTIITGDTFGSGNSRWLGGSGGEQTAHNRSESGIYDLNGNLWEWVDGVCLINGLIMVAGNANTSPTWAGNSFAATEANWYNTGMYIKWAGGAATGFTLGTGGRDSVMTTSKSQAFGLTTGADSLCKAIALGPTSSSAANYGNDYFYVNNNGTFFPIRSGVWDYSSNAGVFSLLLRNGRTTTHNSIGFRACLIE